MKLFLFFCLVLVNSVFAQMSLNSSQNEDFNNLQENTQFSISSQFFTDFESASSSSSDRFMYLSTAMTHPLIKNLKLNHVLRLEKQLEKDRESGVSDYMLSLMGLNYELTPTTNISWTPRVDFVFDELRNKEHSQRSAVRLTQVISQSFFDKKMTISQVTGFVKNQHRYKTRFNGESNSSHLLQIGISPNLSLSDKTSLSTSGFLIFPYTYDKKSKDTLSSFDVSLVHSFSSSFSMSLGVSTLTKLLSDLGVNKGAKDYLIGEEKLLTLGARVTL